MYLVVITTIMKSQHYITCTTFSKNEKAQCFLTPSSHLPLNMLIPNETALAEALGI